MNVNQVSKDQNVNAQAYNPIASHLKAVTFVQAEEVVNVINANAKV